MTASGSKHTTVYTPRIRRSKALEWLRGTSVPTEAEKPFLTYLRRERESLVSELMKSEDTGTLIALLDRLPRLSPLDIDRYISLSEGKAALTSALLTYKQRRFTPETVESAEREQEEKELGLRSLTLNEWRQRMRFSYEKDGTIRLTGTRSSVNESDTLVIPSCIGQRRVSSANVRAFYGQKMPTMVPPPELLSVCPGPPKDEELRPGSEVLFGAYPKEVTGQPEPLRWRVLKREEGRCLIVTERGIDCLPYHNCWVKSLTWEECDLRKWLNGAFFAFAFSQEEKRRIQPVMNANPANPAYGTAGGNPTRDRIFLLSAEEAARFFEDDSARRTTVTEYAMQNGAYVTYTGSSWWWLRTPGNSENEAAHVYGDGDIYTYGTSVYFARCSVRPALWLQLT